MSAEITMKPWTTRGKIRRFVRNIIPRRLFAALGIADRGLPAQSVEVERAELLFYIRNIEDGAVVFDVGANVGRLTILFAKLVGPHGQVHAFEPVHDNFTRLKTVCDASRSFNVRLNEVAITDSCAVVPLHVYDEEFASWSTLAERSIQLGSQKIVPIKTEDVPSTTIDVYCEQESIETIDLLKIDVEGAEYQVLRGAEGMLRRSKIKACTFEFGQTTTDMGVDPRELRQYLERFKYRIGNVVGRDPIFPVTKPDGNASFSVMYARAAQ
jgi:FkbM family methyltransferase